MTVNEGNSAMLRNRLPLVLAALALGACGALSPSFEDPYATLTDADVGLAARALQVALEVNPDGGAHGWRNPATGNAGVITPVATYQTENGYVCRDYEERLVADGHDVHTVANTACRDGNGRWYWI